MTFPSTLDVVIEYDEEKREDAKGRLVRSVQSYGDYGPMAEYETDNGDKFWIVAELLQKCRENNVLPRIPVEVITKNKAIQDKLQYGREQLARTSKQQDTKIILPDGFKM